MPKFIAKVAMNLMPSFSYGYSYKVERHVKQSNNVYEISAMVTQNFSCCKPMGSEL